jgi:NADH dehydrogenase (ubiquinone) 1 alpha/beta subcomplex 1
MFRSAIVRSLRASAPRVIKTPAPFQIRSSIAAIPQFTPFQGARLYSAPAGLSKTEAEGRIVNLLKNFDKVRHIVFPGESHYSSAMNETTQKQHTDWSCFIYRSLMPARSVITSDAMP